MRFGQMVTAVDWREWALAQNPDVEFIDGLDAAIIGVAVRCGEPAAVIYDGDSCLKILERDMGADQANEFFWREVVPSCGGAGAPVFLIRPEVEHG